MFAIALFLVLPALFLLFVNWQYALIGVGVWLLVRAILAASGDKGVRREQPTLGYLPRWTPRRRWEAERELAQWQAWFDATK